MVNSLHESLTLLLDGSVMIHYGTKVAMANLLEV